MPFVISKDPIKVDPGTENDSGFTIGGEVTPEGSPIYDEDDILTKAGWRYRKKTTDTDMVQGAIEAAKGLLRGFTKIPDLVRSKGVLGAANNIPEGLIASGQEWVDIVKSAASKNYAVVTGMSEEQDLDRQYDNYRELAERSVEQVKRSRSRVGDFFRAVGLPEQAVPYDESVDQETSDFLSLVLDPTNLIGGGSLKALLRAGKGAKVAAAGGKVAVAGEKALQAAEKVSAEVAEKTAKGLPPIGDGPAPINFIEAPSAAVIGDVGKGVENVGKFGTSVGEKLADWQKANPIAAPIASAALAGYGSDWDPLAIIGGAVAPSAIKAGATKLKLAGEAAQVAAVASREGIDVAAKSGIAGEKVSAIAKRLDTPAVNFLLSQSAQLADAVGRGAFIGGGLGYALNNDPEQSGFGSGFGSGIVGGGMGRFQSIGIDQAGRVAFHRPDADGKWVRVSESPAALAKDQDLAISFLASRSLPERTALAGRLNIAELAELARGEAAAKGANRVTGSDMKVRFLDSDGMVAAGFDPTVAKVMQGVTETDQKPTLYVNLDVATDPAYTLWHEGMHGFDRLAPDEVGGKQTDAGAALERTRAELKAFYFGSYDASGKQTSTGKYDGAQFLKLEDQYLSRVGMSEAEMTAHIGQPMSKRAAYIADEMAAEHAGMLGRLSGGDIGKASRYPSTALGRAALGVLARTRIGLESLGIVFDGGGDVVTSGIFKDPTTGKRLELSSDVREKLSAYLRAKDKITTRMSIDFDESPITEVVNARDLAKASTTPETLARWKNSGMFALDDKGEIRMMGGKPVFLTAAERKKVDANRSLAIFTAIKAVPDDGSPGLRSEVIDGVETFKGTKLSKAQVDAVLALPDAVLPPSVKARISELVKLQEVPGGPVFADYNKAITGGRYDSKASISTQIFVPMSLSISAAGNFLVSSFSVVGYERKVAMWKKTKKKFFEPWDGNMDSFHNDVRTYLNNQESGAGNVAVGKEAITKKSAINDFLASVLVGDMNRVSTKSNSDNLIRSFRVDRMQSIERAGGDNMPYDYGKVRANFMPANDEAVMGGQARSQPADADYLAAVKAGDTAKAQQMVDQAAKDAGYTVKAYHGTNSRFRIFKPQFGKALWFSEDRAKIAAGEAGAQGTKNIMEVYLRPGRVSGWDEYNKLGEGQITRDFDSTKLDDDWIVYDPANIKSANAVTRSMGEVVPISQRFNEKSKDTRFQPTDVDYRGEHTAPKRDGGSPLNDLSGTYPDDIYSFKAAQYYGHWGDARDSEAIGVIQSLKGKPNASVKIYRAVPTEPVSAAAREAMTRLESKRRLVASSPHLMDDPFITKQISELEAQIPAETKLAINPGDWVTTARSYAVDHGESALRGNYKILSKTVKASDVFTNGDSIFEFGYDPVTKPASERFQPADTDYLAAVKAGDMKAVQRMVDAAAKAAGHTIEAWRGSTQPIAPDGKISTSQGGIHFSENKEESKGYMLSGSRNVASEDADLIHVALNPGRVLDLRNIKNGDDLISRFEKAGLPMEYAFDPYPWSQHSDHKKIPLRETLESIIKSRGDGWSDFSANEEITDALTMAGRPPGIDSIAFFEHGNPESTSWVMMRPESIKSADPITRDAQGNVIPLSKRFNTTSEDIRYQPADENAKPSEIVAKAGRVRINLDAKTVADIDSKTAEIRYSSTADPNAEGRLETSDGPNGEILVENHYLSEELRGSGYGGKAVRKLQEMTGRTIISDEYPSSAARAMWDRLGAKRERVQLSEDESQIRYVLRPQREGAPVEVNENTRYQPAETPSEVSDAYDSLRVGTAKLGTKAKPVETPSSSNIAGNKVPAALLAEQMEVVNYPHLPSEILTEKDPVVKRRKFIDFQVANLLALYDAFPESLRARATLWYDGANRLAKETAQAFGYTAHQVAGVMAALSPQKDWFMNVAQARQLIEIWNKHQDVNLDAALIKAQVDDIVAGTIVADGNKKKAQEGETPRAKKKRNDYNAQLDVDVKAKRLEILSKMYGKSIRQLGSDPDTQAWAIRTLAQTIYGRDYRNLSPEGDFLGYAMAETGERKKNGWGSMSEIKKCVRILEDGSVQNISNNLGIKHKVRNFYNNIIAPNSPYGDATIDTHHVAAANLMPYGSSAEAVAHNFGSGVAGSDALGISGTYHLYLDAIREAAALRGLQPRQMQSITWEAIRLIWPSKTRRDAKVVADALNKWKTLSNEDARTQLTRSIPDPVWARTGNGGEPGGVPAILPEKQRLDNDAGGGLSAGDRPSPKRISGAVNEDVLDAVKVLLQRIAEAR